MSFTSEGAEIEALQFLHFRALYVAELGYIKTGWGGVCRT